MELAPALGTLVAPLDVIRRWALGVSLRFTPLAWVLVRRDRRVCIQAAAGMATTFTLTLFFPAFLFSVTPSLFGVAHVASDVRYLVLRRSLPRAAPVLVAMFAAGMVALRIDEAIGSRQPALSLEMALGWGWVVAMIAIATYTTRRWGRGALALLVAAPLAYAAISNPWWARLTFAHAHNLIGMVLWVALFRRRTTLLLAPMLVYGAAIVAIASGVTIPIADNAGGLTAFHLSLREVSEWLAPGFAPTTALKITLAYVFLQGVHYGVWLGWLPQDDIQAQGTTSFAMSVKSMARDFTGAGLIAIVVTAIAVFALSFVDLHATRNFYLSFATFHGYLEVAMLGYFAVAGRPQPLESP